MTTDERKDVEQMEDTEGLYAFAMRPSDRLLAKSTEEQAKTTDTEPDTTPKDTVDEVVDEATEPESTEVDEVVSDGEVEVENDDTNAERYVIPYRANGEDREFEYQLEDGKLSADTISKLAKALAMEGLHEKVQRVQEERKKVESDWQRRAAEQEALIQDYRAKFESVRPLAEAVQRDPRIAQAINKQFAPVLNGQQIKSYDPREMELQRREAAIAAQNHIATVQEIEQARWAKFRETHTDLTEDEVGEVREFLEANAADIDRIPLDPRTRMPLVPLESLRGQLLNSPEVAYGMMVAQGKARPRGAKADAQKLEQKLSIAKSKANVKNVSAGGGNGKAKVPAYVEKEWHELSAEEQQARIDYELKRHEKPAR